ncbi:MAG TPA: cobalt ABC transporter substrate-binding protein CbiN [Desulfuromonadales bacterium]|nr:cobalt ABC transporter substrate-binding protein CbiN [Desulfuromonadales bacterium]
MKERHRNVIVVASFTALAAFPLLIVKQAELFRGTDDQAVKAIQTLAPSYVPWFQSICSTSDPVAITLLFTIQGAIGAAFIAYYLISSRRQASKKDPQPGAGRAY